MIVPISHYQVNSVFKLLYPYYVMRAHRDYQKVCISFINSWNIALDKFPVEYFEDYNYEWKIQGYG